MVGRKHSAQIGTSKAAQILDVSTTTVRRLVDSGQLTCTETSIGRVFDEAVVEALAKERKRNANATS